MPRVKVARKSTAIDMTAMCDVAFLLLTFFILSAKQKTQDPIKAEVPASTSIQVVPEHDFTTIIIGDDKAFLDINDADLRKQTLQTMSEKYKVSFTPDEITAFTNVESFGVPMSQLKQFLDLPTTERAHVKQSGIPVDTTDNNELYDWIHAVRVTDKYLNNKELKIGIKGDRLQEYPIVQKVIATLQKQKVDRFNLITALKTAK